MKTLRKWAAWPLLGLLLVVLTGATGGSVTKRDAFSPHGPIWYGLGINVEVLAATHTIALTDPQWQALDPDGSHRTVTLPAEGIAKKRTGMMFGIYNWAGGAENLVVKNDAAGTIATLGQGTSAIFILDNAATWKVAFLSSGDSAQTDSVVETTPAAGVTVDGLLIKDGDLVVGDSDLISFGAGVDSAFTHDGTTGLDLTVTDNDAGAFTIKEAANNYMTFITTNASELISVGVGMLWADSTVLSIGDGADVTLTHDGTTGLDMLVTDNDGGAFTIKEAANSYVTIDTTNATELINIGQNVLMVDSTVLAFGAGSDTTLTHDGTTGLDIAITDNDAGGLTVAEGANPYMGFVSSDDAERVTVSKLLTFPTVTTSDMANAAHALVIAAAGAGETQLLGNIVFVDANGGAQILTLPAEAGADGMLLNMFNTGGEQITIKDDAAATAGVLETTEHGMCACDGVTWYCFIGAET